MSKLQLAVAAFVENLFRTLRNASLVELGALARTPRPELTRVASPHRERASGARRASKPIAAPAKAGSSDRARERAQRTPLRVAPARRRGRAAEPPMAAEITDPESLLGAVRQSPHAAAPLAPTPLPHVARSAAPSVRFEARADEAIVRVSNGGVVIRRSSRA